MNKDNQKKSQFFQTLFTENEKRKRISSRRAVGIVGFLAFIVGLFMGYDSETFRLLGTLSAGLIASTTFDKFRKQSTQTTETTEENSGEGV